MLSSKTEAEVKLREDFAYGARMEMFATSRPNSSETRYHYGVTRRHEPVMSYTTGYYMTNTTPPCKLANDPQRPAACESEAEAAKNRAEQIRTNSYPSCTLVSYSLRGNYTEPYSAIRPAGGSGNIYYGAKFLDVVVKCGTAEITAGDTIHKATSFDCPAGFTPVTQGTPPVVLPAVCGAPSTSAHITGPAPSQLGSCSTKRPCHPRRATSPGTKLISHSLVVPSSATTIHLISIAAAQLWALLGRIPLLRALTKI